jgi:putative ABC transport system permease protein
MRFHRWFHMLPLRLRSLFRRDRVEQELSEELEYHLDRQIRQNVEKGMSAREARYAALRAFGPMDRHKEEARDKRGVKVLEDFWQDLRYGSRTLRRHRGFTLVALVTLALGIGANTTVFTVINAVLLRPLPYQSPEKLVRVWAKNQREGTRLQLSQAEFFDLQSRNQVFDEIATFFPPGFTLTGTDEPERVGGGRVSASFFPLLGVSPFLGRTFTPEEDRPGTPRIAVISHSIWQRRFGGEKDIIGKAAILSGNSYTIIGVLPENFTTPGLGTASTPDIWVPLGTDTNQNTRARYLRVFARLKPEVDLRQAQAEMDGFAGQLAAASPESNTDVRLELVSFHDQMVGQVRPALLMLTGAAGLLLLIACSNIANLLLARATDRRREIALRIAVGARRSRLIRQLVTEVLLLFMLGGALGFLVTYWSNDFVVALVTGMLPRAREIELDLAVFLFTLGISLATALLFGLAPALKASNLELAQSMKGAAYDTFRVHAWYGLRSWLVVSQVALSLLLLIGAGLLIQNFVRLRMVDPGFKAAGVLNTRISLPSARYPGGQGISAFNQQLIERVKGLPGVTSAAVLDWMPFGDTGGVNTNVVVDDRKASAELRVISPAYFDTMEIPLKQGRKFSSTDSAVSPQVFIISESAARKYWPNGDAIGARIGVQGEPVVTGEVVGVVGDVKHYTLNEEPAPHVYAPHTQPPWMNWETRELLVRTAGDPLALSDAVRREIRVLEKDVPITGFRSMDQVVSAATAQPAFYALLVGLFAGLALTLAAVGIYGVVSFWVGQRSREIAICMALGARQADAQKRIVWQSGALIAIGVAIGLAAAFALTRFLSKLQFFAASPTDPVIFVSVPVFVVVIALSACYLPARHASRVDPITVLRHE